MFSHWPTPLVRVTPLLLLSILAGVPGCGRVTRTKQCRALIARVNPALDDVLGATHGNTTVSSSSSYLAAAARYERLAKQLGPLEFASEEMAKDVAEYASVLSSSAQSLRALATALDSNDPATAEKSSRDLERLVSHERSVVARMDAWCQP